IVRHDVLAPFGDEREIWNPIVRLRRRVVEDVDLDYQLSAGTPARQRPDELVDFRDNPLMLVRRGWGHVQYALPRFIETVDACETALCQLFISDAQYHGLHDAAILLPSNGTSQRRRRLWQGPDDARESAALEQLASFPAASGDFVFRRADRLFRAPRRFHGQ